MTLIVHYTLSWDAVVHIYNAVVQSVQHSLTPCYDLVHNYSTSLELNPVDDRLTLTIAGSMLFTMEVTSVVVKCMTNKII